MNNKSLPKPLPEINIEPMELNHRILPDPMREYIVDIAERQSCPIDFVAIAAMVGAASLVGRKALIRPKQHDNWIVTPNLWGLAIGRPSSKKSPAVNAALAPLIRINDTEREKHIHALRNYNLETELSEIGKTAAKDEAKKQLRNHNREAAKLALENAESYATRPTRTRLIIHDSTVEKLGELLNENQNGMLLHRDEAYGLLSTLSKEEHQSERAFYLQCYDGNGSYSYDRIGRGTIDIKSTTLSIIGTIQPSKIKPIVKMAVDGTIDDGLIQRFQLTVCPSETKYPAWIDRSPNEAAKNIYDSVFEKLHTSPTITPLTFQFDPGAQLLFQLYVEELADELQKEDINPALESHFQKMHKTIPALALLIQLIEHSWPNHTNSDAIVKESSMVKAIGWSDYLKSHALKLYQDCLSPSLSAAHALLAKISKLNDEFTIREIKRKCWTGLTDNQVIENAVAYLVDYGHVVAIEVPSTVAGGRPSMKYVKHDCYKENIPVTN